MTDGRRAGASIRYNGVEELWCGEGCTYGSHSGSEGGDDELSVSELDARQLSNEHTGYGFVQCGTWVMI